MIFSREVDTRAIDFDNGNVTIVDLDCCDGKKCRDGYNGSAEDVGFNFEFHLKEAPPALGMVPQ